MSPAVPPPRSDAFSLGVDASSPLGRLARLCEELRGSKEKHAQRSLPSQAEWRSREPRVSFFVLRCRWAPRTRGGRMGHDQVVHGCIFARVHPHFTQSSRRPPAAETLSTAHSPQYILVNTRHIAQAPQSLKAQSCPQQRTCFWSSAHTPALRVHPRTAAPLVGTHVHARRHSYVLSPSLFFFFSAKRQLRARRPWWCREGSSPRRGRYRQLLGAHLALSREASGRGCPTPQPAKGAALPCGSQKARVMPPFL